MISVAVRHPDFPGSRETAYILISRFPGNIPFPEAGNGIFVNTSKLRLLA